ncbi:hypothetical protein FRC12_010019 [Ceratobasidium sp. 428]|nr:hypothetical protein FRC09_020812 [Ceratobasidium sp. 395]KAG8758409.1 hypothetical protein FRC12_010019 [Ceratobasidium sp. 428]
MPMVAFNSRLSRSALEPTKMALQSGGDGTYTIPSKSARRTEIERIPEATRAILLPLEIQAMVIEQVAADLDPESRIYPVATRDTLRALCVVSKYFESIAIRYLYMLVHLTSAVQLSAFQKAIAYFGRPTALAKYVRTFSISSTTHIASFQFAQDLIVVLQTLRPWATRLLLDVRRRHHLRQTSGAMYTPILQAYELMHCPRRSAGVIFDELRTPWPNLIEVSISEGLAQYIGSSPLPRAFGNTRRLALGYAIVTTDLINSLLEMTSLEVLILVNSRIRWSDFQTSPAESIAAFMQKSPALRRLIWLITPRPLWDMEEMTSISTIAHDAKVLCSVPDAEVIYWPHEELNTNDILPDSLPGSALVGEGAKAGWLWKYNELRQCSETNERS